MYIDKSSPIANVYALMAIASRQIEEKKNREEMVAKVTKSDSYENAIDIINEYIEDKIVLI